MSAPATGPRRLSVLLLVAAFVVLALPKAGDVRRYHGDERFYTDAALGMRASGDWGVPRYPEGRVRVNKPIATYWVLGASYGLLGPSLFASRLPFLLAGGLLVWLTWRLAWSWLRDGQAALLAAAIVAASPDVLLLSLRSTPDILLCAALAAGLLGFAALLRGDGSVRAAAAWAWLGFGLAGAVKGGLALVLLGWAAAWALAAPGPRGERLRRLLHPVWMPVGIALAALGFGLFALWVDPAALAVAYDEQTGGGAHGLGEVPGRLLRYARIPVEHLAPWFALVALGALAEPRALGDWLRRHRFAVGFGVGWTALLVLTFSFGGVVRGRYLAPAYPALAVPLAGSLATLARGARAGPWLRGVALAALVLVAAVALLGLPFALRIDLRLAAALLAAGGAAALGFVWGRRRAAAAPLLALAGPALVVLTLGDGLVRASFARTPVPALAARLEAPELAGLRVAQVGDSAHLASKLRIFTGGRIPVDAHQRGVTPVAWEEYDVVVSDAPPPPEAAALGFRAEPVGESWGDAWTVGEIWQVVSAAEPAEVLRERSQPHYLLLRAPEQDGDAR